MPDHPAAKLCRPGTVPAGTVPGETVRPGWCPPPAPDQHHHRPRAAPPPGTTTPAEKQSQSSSAYTAPPALAFSFAPSSRPAPAPALPRRRPDDDGGGLPDLPGLGGVGLPDEQQTARPITCLGCSFQPDPADLMTPPPCCPHPCQPYRQRQPPARQHPAASPTPEGSDSPPNGIWL